MPSFAKTAKERDAKRSNNCRAGLHGVGCHLRKIRAGGSIDPKNFKIAFRIREKEVNAG